MVWVHFPGLSLEYWDEKTLFTISRAIGNPVKVDATALNYQSGFYAKVLIEVDIAKQIPNKLWIITRYRAFSQGIILTNLPKFFSKCKIVGHLPSECRFNRQASSGDNAHTPPQQQQKINDKHANATQLFPNLPINGNVSPKSLNIITPTTSASSFKNPEIPQPSLPSDLTTSGDPPTILVETVLVEPSSLEFLVTSQKEVSTSSLLEFGIVSQHVTIVPNIASSTEIDETNKVIGVSKKKPHIKPTKPIATRKSSREVLEHVVQKGGISPPPIPPPFKLSPPSVVTSSSQCVTVEIGGVLVTGVHANSYTVNRRKLRQNLFGISLLNKPWLLMGDFNYVLSVDEKKGGRSPFYSASWGIYDHGYLIGYDTIIPRDANIPFRFQKMWFSHPSFMQVVFNSWNEELVGNPIFIFMNKLKRLKKILKIWNWEVFGDVKVNLSMAEDKVMAANAESDNDPSNAALLNKLVTAIGEYDIAANNYHTFLRDKARENWIRDRDINYNSFHTSIKLRQQQNSIAEIEDSSSNIITDQQGIANVLIDYFSKKFEYQNVQINDSIFDGVPYIITEDDNLFLEGIPDADEIKRAVFVLNQDGAPGPDGFTGFFYKASWDIINNNLVDAIQFCWQNIMIPSGMNSNFLVLILKIKGAKNAKCFRPIGLSNFFF
ncbi:uncharacterized protein LOC113352188 [Papaver somniferum]|uniref:uncharacterized protein LOC113352188 n=1 Tax=Papaver somniferum TaxID=3469 RepID=UPI000E6FB8D2|nr:uncharacterized protein LOC113352188 [Papaver somniferum]